MSISIVRTALVLFAAFAGAVGLPASASAAPTLPAGFALDTALEGLEVPTAVRFAPDGRIFVAEKSGLIKVFEGLDDPDGAVFADLRTQTYNEWDRGLLDIALDPDFTNEPYVYALYSYDRKLGGGPAPEWGSPGETYDFCPTPPGPNTDGCEISGRLSRMSASGDAAGPEQVLLTDWCSQFTTHSIGSLAFDDSGALYVSGGDGAGFDTIDYGQYGDPLNPCGDPPGGEGAALSPPTAEGGALRSQDLRTSGDPAGLDGTIARVDRETGAALPGNPNAAAADANARRVIGYGLRNPFRFTIRPGTKELWIGEVGWNTWEEINRQNAAELVNYGWPCYEGGARQPAYDDADLNICEGLYAAGAGAVRGPHFAYRHTDPVVPGDGCPTGGSSPSGLQFYTGGPFPNAYDGSLFFVDYSRNCIWVMRPGPGGVPDPDEVVPFGRDISGAVNLTAGEDGALYYPDVFQGQIKVIRYYSANQPPSAVITADKTFGHGPLTVRFDGSGSTDPEGTALRYAWDLDGDGQFDDSTRARPEWTFDESGAHLVRLRVTDQPGLSDTARISIQVDNTPPVVSIDSPGTGLRWAVGEEIAFSASAVDAEQGVLPASAFKWDLVLHHCPGSCHQHFVSGFEGKRSGSFAGPDHEYPSHLELKLTVTDEGGLETSKSIDLEPLTVSMKMRSWPPGAPLTANAHSAAAPFQQEVIARSAATISASNTFDDGLQEFEFSRWRHGGDRVQGLTVPRRSAAYWADYEAAPGQVRFLRVLDGRTLRVRASRGKASVRLVGVRVPGRRTCRGRKARRALERLVRRGDRLELEWDSKVGGSAPGGRFYRYVSGRRADLGKTLIRRGVAKRRRGKFDRRAEYRRAERQGRRAAKRIARRCRRA